MADVIITSVLSIVSALCSCSSNNRSCYLLDLKENKDALHTAMEDLKATRDDVRREVDEVEKNPNELMKRTNKVDRWLQDVQTIEGEVVKVIQTAGQEIEGRCFGDNFPINCRSACKIGKLVNLKLEIVNDLRSKAGSLGDVAYRLSPPVVQPEPVDLTVGMESMFDEVWRLLAEDKVRIMGLYGYGGVGKTTLLNQINNAFLKTTTTTITTSNSNNTATSSNNTTTSNNNSNNLHGFDVVILVVVSKEINIDAIQKEIGDRLGLPSPNRRSIFNALTKKNFVLLLDDLWERVDLLSIGIPPSPENKKSKVVFTTRSEIVCGHMDAHKKFRVECLPWDKAWTLFQKKVGNEALNSHPKVPELAEIVAKECGGLPLALITIGRAMSSKKTVEEWNYAITTLQRYASEFPGMGDEVLPLLKLSYDNLGDAMIKSCFLYCALFPEDESINIPQLIDYWIGEGLISLNEFDRIDDARNQGYYVIGILKGASLLENGEDEDIEVKMHDTIRDLALWIAHDCESRRDKMLIIKRPDLTTAERSSSSSWYNNAERICVSIIYNGKVQVPVPLPTLESPPNRNLLTLIYKWTIRRTLLIIPQNFFSFMPLLRVLDLSSSHIETFPTSITDLLELRYLSLSDTKIKELPEELGKLVKLNYLDLSFNRGLKEIPSGVIGSLLELRVLNLYSCFAFWDLSYSKNLRKIPSGVIGSLVELRDFNLYLCDQVDWDFDELYKLKHLNDLGININTQHNLNKLLSNQSLQMCTRRLHLFSSSTTTTLEVGNIKSLEKLELLSNLEKLFLVSLPELMNVNMGVWEENHYNYMPQEAPLQNLGQIVIGHCNALKDLTWVGYVVNLKELYVSNCEELEEIVIRVVVDDLGGSTRGGGGEDEISMVMNKVEDVFKRLKTLTLSFLPKLKSICRNALAFPCLESLEVDGCPQLKKLPFDSGSNLHNTLQKIYGEPKWWSELQWEEEENHNNNNELLKSKFRPYFRQIAFR